MNVETGGIGGASAWIQGMLGGSLIFGLATLGVLGMGVASLRARISMRRGMTTIIGCFIMFGATSIARALISHQPEIGTDPWFPANQVNNATMPPKAVQKTDDPYAGSSLVPDNS